MTDHQQEVFDNMLESKEKIVFFTAPGGHGKTHSISKWIKSLPADANVMVTSTTHQALAVLSDMIPEEYDCTVTTATIHSFLGYQLKYTKFGAQELAKGEGSKYAAYEYDYLVIDEVSMLPTIIDKEIKEGLDQIKEKIIYVGDESQLSISEFLDLSSIEKHRLTVNMRQDADSPINTYCTELRYQIKTHGGPIPIPKENDQFIFHETHGDFIKAYKDSKEDDKFIIAYMNKTVTKYNHSIKQYVKKADLYSEGDKIILLDPHIAFKKTVFNNRERLTIVGRPVKKNYATRINLKAEFDYYEFLVENKHGKKSVLKVPRTRSDFLAQTNVLRDKALADRNWRPFYAMKEEFNLVHHAYAGTVHSAQGATYDEVFIDLADFKPPNDPLNQTLLRMVYVAISRAKKRVHIYNSTEPRDFTKFGD